MPKKILFPLIAAAATLFVVVSHMTYNDELDQQAHYCEMVAFGHWPAYDKTINCEGTGK